MATCRTCPARLPCLLDALDFEADEAKAFGIRGGYTGPERIELIRELAAAVDDSERSAVDVAPDNDISRCIPLISA